MFVSPQTSDRMGDEKKILYVCRECTESCNLRVSVTTNEDNDIIVCEESGVHGKIVEANRRGLHPTVKRLATKYILRGEKHLQIAKVLERKLQSNRTESPLDAIYEAVTTKKLTNFIKNTRYNRDIKLSTYQHLKEFCEKTNVPEDEMTILFRDIQVTVDVKRFIIVLSTNSKSHIYVVM